MEDRNPTDAPVPLTPRREWPTDGYWPRKGMVLSVAWHIGIVFVLLGLARVRPVVKTTRQHVDGERTTLLAPPPATAATSPRILFPGLLDADSEPAKSELAPLQVDLSALKVHLADDVTGQLPDVLILHHGMIALVDREDLTIARYRFQSPEWDIQDGATDISSGLRISMDPPQKWAVLREIASRYDIPMERYRVCAVFDIEFRHCLLAAIRSEALARKLSGRIAEVSLAFSMSQPCGIEVQEVLLAASPARAL
jgi:hypothetical protein